ncbi:hypothetical protein FOCC_FOCC012211 [Frankliniella occidentalis]|nr:hypothetical protein FOCC_FOCC012211 [Frankliniella occidentalis]
MYVPGLVKQPGIDRMSALSRDEQKDCLRLYQKFYGRPVTDLTPCEKAEYQLFQSLLRRVQAEQKEFLDHAKQDWLDYADRTSKIKGDAYNFVLQHWTDKVSHAMAQYPKNYKLLRTVSLLRKSNTVVKMHLIKNILNIGKVPISKLPQFDAPFRIATSLIRLRTWRYLNIPPGQLSGTLHKVPVSRDPNAERLARLHGADVVMSTSAFKCLLDNYDENKHPHHSGVGKSWIIPVIVKEHRSFCDGKPISKTIVFLDKALPLSRMTKFDKVCTYQKHGLLAALVHRHNEGGIEFDIKGDDIMIRKPSVDDVIPPKNFTQVRNDKPAPPDSKQNDNQSSMSAPSKSNENLVSSEICTKNVDLQVSDRKSLEEKGSDGNDNDEDDDDSSDEFGLTIALSDEETNTKKTSITCPKENPSSSQIQAVKESENHTPSKSENDPTINSRIKGLGESENQSVNEFEQQEVNEPENQTVNDSGKPEVNESKNQAIKDSGNQEANLSENQAVNLSDTESRVQIACNDSQVVEGSVENTLKPLESESTVQSNGKNDLSNRWEKTPAPPLVKTVNGNALPPNTTNVMYNLWSLQDEKNKANPLEENSAKNINLLIRSRIDGCESLGSGAYEPLTFAVKPEYQLEYGAGVVALSDLTRQWAKLLIQPNTSLARVRVNVTTSEMVKVEKCSKEEVAADAKLLYNEDLSHTLMTLNGVLLDLMSLSSGEYLLSHTPDMGLNAKLFKTTIGNEAVDWYLPAGYGALPGEIGCDVPWQPLDSRVIMPKNLLFHQMPCTFQPYWAPDIKPKQYKPKPPKFATINNLKSKKKKKNKKKGKKN